MIYDMEASGKRLKELRKQAGKTQEQVAEVQVNWSRERSAG